MLYTFHNNACSIIQQAALGVCRRIVLYSAEPVLSRQAILPLRLFTCYELADLSYAHVS